MTTKMTNEEMRITIEAMKAFENDKGKFGYAIARNLRKMKDAATEYLNIWTAAVLKYGEKGKDDVYTVSNEKRADFDAEIGELATIEHDVEIYQISLDEFLAADLSSSQMAPLLWMVYE